MLHLAQMFDLSAATIRQYIKCYNTDGLNGLHPQYGAGRRPKIDWSNEQWADVLNQAPSQFDKLDSGAQKWTQDLLREYLALYHDLRLSQGTISKALKRVGLNWRRTKLTVTSADPLYTVKRQRLEDLKNKALQAHKK